MLAEKRLKQHGNKISKSLFGKKLYRFLTMETNVSYGGIKNMNVKTVTTKFYDTCKKYISNINK
jgi:hypothetical protein